jgi:predicted NUDIX family phosphoesterase
MKKEQILCIETSHLAALTSRTGFIPVDELRTDLLLGNDQAWFAPRHVADDKDVPRFDFRQIIPYVVLVHYDRDEAMRPKNYRVALYRRTKQGGESRLHDRYSIGFGGHINLADAVIRPDGTVAFMQTVMHAGVRELQEEVDIPGGWQSWQITGFLNLTDSDVNRVHLGAVIEVRLAKPEVLAKEADLADIQLVTPAELAPFLPQMEGWSRVLANACYR